MKKPFKLICCYCGHIHLHNDIDEPLEKCALCKQLLSIDALWISHAVRFYVEDADPKIIEQFIKEVKSKRTRYKKKKKNGVALRKSSRTAKKVA